MFVGIFQILCLFHQTHRGFVRTNQIKFGTDLVVFRTNSVICGTTPFIIRKNPFIIRINQVIFIANPVKMRTKQIIFRTNPVIFRSNPVIFLGKSSHKIWPYIRAKRDSLRSQTFSSKGTVYDITKYQTFLTKYGTVFSFKKAFDNSKGTAYHIL